jgi:surface protein
MRKKLLSLLVLLMTAATGAWADSYLYFVKTNPDTKSATLMYGTPSNAYYHDEDWDCDDSGWWGDLTGNYTSITIDESCLGYTGTTLANLFFDFSELTSISGFENLGTTNVTDMHHMFSGCQNLATLDLSSLDTSNATDMYYMFADCSSLTTLTFGGSWDTGNVEYMFNMFSGCSSLSSLDLSSWDTSSVEDMEQMFYDCINLTTLNITGWDTSNVTNSDEMFEGCTKLYKSVTLKEGATGEYWATFYDETTGYNYQAPEGTQVFKVNLSGNEIEMTEIDDHIVKSGQGVVLKSTSDNSITMTPTIATSADDYTGNSLLGTLTVINTTGPNNYYVLNKMTAGVGFYKLSNTNGTIGANKAYLTYTAGAREFFLFDEATGIEGVSVSDGENGEVYDLQGRRVSQPAKGLYIVRSAALDSRSLATEGTQEGRLQGKNGKKVIINK